MFESKGKYQNPNSYFRIIFEICGQKILFHNVTVGMRPPVLFQCFLTPRN